MRYGSYQLGHAARVFFLLAILNGIASQGTLASGSYDSPGASGANQAYILGKSVLHKKLLCDRCPLAGTEPDASSAADLVQRVQQADAFADRINPQEREAVVAYLKRRFGL